MFCFQIHARAYCTMNEKFSILHEAKLSAVLKISSSLYSKQVRVFENIHELTVSNPFNIQFEFTAGDRLTMASRPTCLNEKTMNTAQFLCVIVITHSVTLMSLGNGKPRDQF